MRSDAERAIRVAHLSAALGTLGLAAQAIADSRVVEPTWIELGAIAVCGAVWVWLTARPGPSLAGGSLAFAIVNAAIVVALWDSSRRLGGLEVQWVPFRAHQLGALTVALLAPPVAWVGILTILGFIGAAVLQYALFDPTIREHLPYGDPFASLAYGAFAIALYVFRLRATFTEREIARVHAEAESFERLARAMCAFRDLSNTPLQTLVNSVELLRQHGVNDLADRIERAVLRLRQLEEHTRPYESQLHWRNGDETWDPWAILRPLR